jgi:hypothetical protein
LDRCGSGVAVISTRQARRFFPPEADELVQRHERLKSARFGLMHRSTLRERIAYAEDRVPVCSVPSEPRRL